jgi:hypothetical protein
VPVRRLIATASLLVAAAALAWPLGAAGQSGPEELWRAFPLDPRAAPAEPAPQEPPAAGPDDAGDGLSLSLALILGIAAGALCLGAIAAPLVARQLRGRAGPPPAPEPQPEPAAPAAPRPPRAARDEREALELAGLAADYLAAVAAGSRRPVVDLAENRSWSVERTRRALGRARACGLLVGAGRGRAGGVLSGEAERILRASAPPVAEADHQPQAGPGLVDGADLVVDQPGRDADVADHILREVGAHPGGPLRPGRPEAAGGSNGRRGGG